MNKKFILLIVICLIPILYFCKNIFFSLNDGLIKSQCAFELMQQSYIEYIPVCEQSLMAVMQNKQAYDEDMQKIMTLQVYNMLSPTTKSWYTNDNDIDRIKLKIIDERIDNNNPQIIYVDIMLIHLQPVKEIFYGYRIGYGEIKAEKSSDSWKLIYYSGEQGKTGEYYQQANFMYCDYDKIHNLPIYEQIYNLLILSNYN